MDDAVYHVVLDGQMVGPYDRRTIVGMRIKKTLTSDHVVVTSDGVRLSVGDLLKNRDAEQAFQADRSGTYSLVQATYVASLVEVEGRGIDIPEFKGEIEARVQSDVLRIAGRFRQGLGWKEDRIKLPLAAIAYARVRGSLVDLWLRRDGEPGFQTVCLELFTPESAGEFVDWLPSAKPWPGSAAAAQGTPAKSRKIGAAHPLLWGAVVGTILVVTAVLLWVLARH
ncbi:hypothetical protein FN976_03655 [Caenimonas sedimenti]|uniref:Uncharacterized protein n=1 Tax=Caenimonas sedimenti TaxID=2596921 RepID=A0A562ZVL0_9BURK|nr:hypothetical protein [Caenimonas sedimenti]TWO72639.1 hypothetical protein FN976_03655 [Caenimonas sedimenti]